MYRRYDRIDLRELVTLLIDKWWLIMLLVVVNLGGTYFVTKNYIQPVYQAKTSLFIGKEQNEIGGVGISFYDLQMFNQLVIDYNQIIQSDLVIEDVIYDKQLDITIKEFRNNLRVNMIEQSRFFSITYEDTDPELAAEIANELADRLIIVASEIVEVERIIVLNKAKVPVEPIKPKMVINLAIALFFSIAVWILVVVIQEMFNNKIATEQDVEKILQMSVIGVIPNFESPSRSNTNKRKRK